ncbi:MAG: HupE/UreJ family protein [Pseudorhodoplanes sp.]
MRRAALAAALLLLATAAAPAHTVIPGIGGFPGGLLHPLLVPAHVLTLIALGLLSGSCATRTQIRLLGVFAAAAIGAFALIAMAYSATQADSLVLGLGAATGLLLAANVTLPAPAAAAVTAAVSGAVIFDSVPPVLTVAETASSLAGTALSALVLVAATALISHALPQRIRPIAIRIAGSWIAASAIMVLALRLAA